MKRPAGNQSSRDQNGARGIFELLREKIPLFILAFASGVVTLIAQDKVGAVKSFQGYPLVMRLENAVVASARYAFDMFWPVNLAPCYPHPGDTLSFVHVVVAATVLLGITAFVSLLSSRCNYLVVGWLWFLITLVPVIGIVQIGGQAPQGR